VALMLRKIGVREAYAIVGGYEEWQARNYPIVAIERLTKDLRLENIAGDFDKIYVQNTATFLKKPNAFLAGVISDFKPGLALDVAMGQGRNSVFLAEKGWDVTGFDIATEGLRLARASAEEVGRKITTVKATHEDFDYGRNQWDLVVMTYSWAPINKPEFVQRIYDSLIAGGIVLVEDHKGLIQGRNIGDNFLLKWFENFRILRYEVVDSGNEWGHPKGLVYRLLAQKP